MEQYTREKIELMQDKRLIVKLWHLTYSGAMQMNPQECGQLADMIIRLRGKGCNCERD